MEITYSIVFLLMVIIGLQIYFIDKLIKISHDIKYTKNKIHRVIWKYNLKSRNLNSRNLENLGSHLDEKMCTKFQTMETYIKDNTEKLWNKIDDTHDSLM